MSEIVKKSEGELGAPSDPFTPRETRALIEDCLNPWQDTEDSADKQTSITRRRLHRRMSHFRFEAEFVDAEQPQRSVEFLADISPSSKFTDANGTIGVKSPFPDEQGNYSYWIKIGTSFGPIEGWAPPYLVDYIHPEMATLKLHYPKKVYFLEDGASHKTAENALTEFVLNRWSIVGGLLPTIEDVRSATYCAECSGFTRRSGGHWGDLGWVHKLSVHFPCTTIRTLLPADD